MNPLQGRFEDIAVEPGVVSRVRLTVTTRNTNQFPLEVLSTSCSLYISFSEGAPNLSSPSAVFYIGDADREPRTNVMPAAGEGQLALYWKPSAEVLDEIEELRKDRDVILQLRVSSTVIERSSQAIIGSQILTADLTDIRFGGAQFLPLHLPKSKWVEFMSSVGYYDPTRVTWRSVKKLAQEAGRAVRVVEDAARAAKELTEKAAVATLTSAYDAEATKLKNRSIGWLLSAIAIAIATAVLIGVYVYESIATPFTVSQAIIRAAAILALAAFLGIVMKGYAAYRYLELLNRHRVNIGSTFDAFQKAQPSPAAKDLMAALTAQQMLNFGSTGFASRDGKDSSDEYIAVVKELLSKLPAK